MSRSRFTLLYPVLLILFVSCGAGTPTATTAPTVTPVAAKKYRLGLVVQTLTEHDYFVKLKKGADDAAEGTEIEVITVAPPLESDVEKQNEMFADLVKQKVNVIAIAPNGTKAIVPYITQANDANIPVITVDTDSEGGTRASFIGTDNFAAGQLAGKTMVAALKNGGKVIIITGNPDNKTHEDRVDGFNDSLKGSNIEVLTVEAGYSDVDRSADAMANAIAKYGMPDGIYCTSGAAGEGIAKVLHKQPNFDPKSVYFIGFDAGATDIALMREGLMKASVAQNPYLMGKLTVEMAQKLINGETIPRRIDSGTKIITPENVDAYEAELASQVKK